MGRRSAPPFAALVLLAGCVRPPPANRTAVALERDAQSHLGEAALARHQVTIEQNTMAPPTGPEALAAGNSPFDPAFSAAPRGRTAYEERVAGDDLEVARKLRLDAQESCGRLPEANRPSCPLGGAGHRVEPIRNGVRIVADPAVAETLATQLTCALAQAQVARPPDADRCPLFAPGASARVVRTLHGYALDITAPDENLAAEIRRRAGRSP